MAQHLLSRGISRYTISLYFTVEFTLLLALQCLYYEVIQIENIVTFSCFSRTVFISEEPFRNDRQNIGNNKVEKYSTPE